MKTKNFDKKVKRLMIAHNINYGAAVWHTVFGGPFDEEPEEPEPDWRLYEN